MITRDIDILDMYLSMCNVYVPGREEGIQECDVNSKRELIKWKSVHCTERNAGTVEPYERGIGKGITKELNADM